MPYAKMLPEATEDASHTYRKFLKLYYATR